MPTTDTGDPLIASTIRLLDQAEDLVERLDSGTYSASPAGIAPHRVGGHLRHTIEFYECFLDGVRTGGIDYDARKRDASVESDRAAALARIRQIKQLLQTAALPPGGAVLVRQEDGEGFVVSSIGRELQVLNSHTVHHFALIALVLAAQGVPVDPDFGMAPSTLRYKAEARRCAR